MARKYTVTEEEETPDFLIFLEILLCIVIFPIGIVIGIIKLISAISENKEQKKLQKVETARDSDEYNSERLLQLTELKNKGILSDEEFQRLRSEVMRKMMREIDLREKREKRNKRTKKFLIIFISLLASIGLSFYIYYEINYC